MTCPTRFVRPCCFIVALVLVGCGGGPKIVPVQGKVTYNGAALASGTLSFIPDDLANVKPASGVIGPDGNITVTTAKPGDGLMPGKYKVAVQSYVVDPIKTSPAELYKLKNQGLAIPKKYTDVKTSGLTVTVAPAVPVQEVNLELKD